MQCSGSPEDQEKKNVIQISVWSWSCITHSLVQPSVCVCACTYMSELFYRDLCYISHLFCLTLFEMGDAFSDTMDNRSDRKIYSLRRSGDLGIYLTTWYIQKMSFGMIMDYAICIGIFNLCTFSASPSD